MAKELTVYLREDVKPLPVDMSPRRWFVAISADIQEAGILATKYNAFFPWSSIAFFEWRG